MDCKVDLSLADSQKKISMDGRSGDHCDNSIGHQSIFHQTPGPLTLESLCSDTLSS